MFSKILRIFVLTVPIILIGSFLYFGMLDLTDLLYKKSFLGKINNNQGSDIILETQNIKQNNDHIKTTDNLAKQNLPLQCYLLLDHIKYKALHGYNCNYDIKFLSYCNSILKNIDIIINYAINGCNVTSRIENLLIANNKDLQNKYVNHNMMHKALGKLGTFQKSKTYDNNTCDLNILIHYLKSKQEYQITEMMPLIHKCAPSIYSGLVARSELLKVLQNEQIALVKSIDNVDKDNLISQKP